MPDILWCIDNDFEQRYYRSPETLAIAVQDGYYRPPKSQLVTYTRVDGDHPNALDPAVLVTILNKDRPEAERLWGAACRAFQTAGRKAPALERGFKEWQKQTREKLVKAIRKTLP